MADYKEQIANARKLAEGPRTGRLAGKVAIVTGANSLTGIGRATALLFAREGAKAVYVSDYDTSELDSLVQLMGERYPDVKTVAIQGDMSGESTVEALVQRTLDEQGRLDIFYANAGIAPLHLVPHTEAQESLDVLKVNTLSVILALKYASAAMRQTSADKPHSGGAIVATASVAGLRANAGPVDYSASKAAVISIVQSGAYSLMPSGIRVVGVAPGLIATGMTDVLFEIARARGKEGKIGQINPLKRYGAPEEVRIP